MLLIVAMVTDDIFLYFLPQGISVKAFVAIE
jgi:hypothetical protein